MGGFRMWEVGVGPLGTPPALIVEQERRLRPRVGQTERAGIARRAPRSLILSQDTLAFGDIGFGQPFDLLVIVLENIIDAVRSYPLDGARAVLAIRTEQSKCVSSLTRSCDNSCLHPSPQPPTTTGEGAIR